MFLEVFQERLHGKRVLKSGCETDALLELLFVIPRKTILISSTNYI